MRVNTIINIKSAVTLCSTASLWMSYLSKLLRGSVICEPVFSSSKETDALCRSQLTTTTMAIL